MMVQYNGITLFRDDDGTPSRIDIDLHVHGRELNAFLRSHGLDTKEQGDMARSVTAHTLCPAFDGTDSGEVRYLPEVRRRLSEETDKIYSMRQTKPASTVRGEFAPLLLRRIARALRPLPRRREATPEAFVRFCGKDTFWTRFRMQGVPHVTWCVFYTVHDGGVALVRHLTAAVEEDDI